MTPSTTNAGRLRAALAACLAIAALAASPAWPQETGPPEPGAAEVEAEAARAIEEASGAEAAAAATEDADQPDAPAGAAAAEGAAAEAPPAQAETAPAPEIAEGDTGAAVRAAGAANSAFPPELTRPDIPLEELTVRLVPLTKSELSTLAAEWLVIVRRKTQEMAEAQIAIMRTEGEVEDAVRARLTELTTERKALFERFSTVVDSWEKKGGDAAAVADFRAYRNAIIVEETRTADAETLMAQAMTWLTSADGGIELALNILVIVASLSGLLVVARIARRVVQRWIGHVPTLSKLLQAFIVTLIYWLVLAFGLMIVLSGLGIDISPVFALIGGASFILAFAFQDTLGNLASGLMIMINRPFDEGDYVDVGGTAGTVRSVSIVATTILTPDNQVIVIPNKTVWGNVITNVTASATRRVDLTFGISYDDDIEQAIAILRETVEAHPLTLAMPEPTIAVGALGASSVDILCRPWSRTADYWSVYWDLTRQVKERFDAAGITIPYPQQDVHMHTVAPAAARPDEPAAPDAPDREAPPRRTTTASSIAEGDEGHGPDDGERA